MKSNKMTIIWSISLLILSVATLIIVGAKIVGIELPDTMIRVLGIAELITLPIFVFASVKKFLKNNKSV
ncbi:MAG: hypothetical protein E7285_08865 [Lachnospiraceae bacterium]|nr:hypothetical protein [Lachnospiraceae bacterium]